VEVNCLRIVHLKCVGTVVDCGSEVHGICERELCRNCESELCLEMNLSDCLSCTKIISTSE